MTCQFVPHHAKWMVVTPVVLHLGDIEDWGAGLRVRGHSL